MKIPTLSKADALQLLGLTAHVKVASIREAYRERAKLLHPDSSGTHDTTEEFARVNEAYELLMSLPEPPETMDTVTTKSTVTLVAQQYLNPKPIPDTKPFGELWFVYLDARQIEWVKTGRVYADAYRKITTPTDDAPDQWLMAHVFVPAGTCNGERVQYFYPKLNSTTGMTAMAVVVIFSE